MIDSAWASACTGPISHTIAAETPPVQARHLLSLLDFPRNSRNRTETKDGELRGVREVRVWGPAGRELSYEYVETVMGRR